MRLLCTSFVSSRKKRLKGKEGKENIKLMPRIIFKINSKWTLDILEWINYLREQCVKIECQGKRQGKNGCSERRSPTGAHRVVVSGVVSDRVAHHAVSGVVTALIYVMPCHTLMARQEANTIGFTHCGSLAHSLQYLVSRFLSTSPFSGKKNVICYFVLRCQRLSKTLQCLSVRLSK